MDVGKDIPAVFAEDRHDLGDLALDILQAAQGQGVLGVYPAAPEGHFPADLVFPFLGGTAAGGPLDGVEDIGAGLDDHVEKAIDRAAGMQEGFDLRGDAVDFRVVCRAVGEEEFAEGGGGGHQRILVAPVVGVGADNIHIVFDFPEGWRGRA